MVAGGADAWAGAEALLDGAPCADGAGFVVFTQTGPDMLVVDYRTIERLGRIPRSNEGECISLSQAAAMAKEAVGDAFALVGACVCVCVLNPHAHPQSCPLL